MSDILTAAKYLLLLLGLLLVCCSDDIPDVPERLTEDEFWAIKGPDVKILNPIDGSLVGWILMISGSYEGIPKGQEILVYGSSHAIDPDLWYPRAVASMHAGGVWDARVFVGQKDAPQGAKYDICAILADEEEAQQMIDDLLENGEEVEPVDLSGKILARITVERK